MEKEKSYTNSSLACARRCLTEYDLNYNLRLTPDHDDAEARDVGTLWHDAHEARTKGGDPFEVISKRAPSSLWSEKLRRMFAAYEWYYQDQSFDVIDAEGRFSFDVGGKTFRGRRDLRIRDKDGRKGLLERKTTSSDIGDDSMYWAKLPLDTQVGLYAISDEEVPVFIVYDVVRKPTIRPKALAKKDAGRMRKEALASPDKGGVYYDEHFSLDEIDAAELNGQETDRMYGARLTADMGDQPEKYFRRMPVYRSAEDFQTLIDNVLQQAELIEYAQAYQLMHRNPDSCQDFGRCQYFALCSNNIRPQAGDPAPDGYHFRGVAHRELDDDSAEA